MQKTNAQLPEIKLVGITARTNNASEMNPAEAKIGLTSQKYFASSVSSQIQDRVNPGKTFCVYTNYESDVNGAYTYFIGEEVSSFDEVVEGLEKLTIPAHNYTKFTSEPGPMPFVCIGMWQSIWQMSDSDLGGKRSYISDFEVYDERALNPMSTVLDIYIGIDA